MHSLTFKERIEYSGNKQGIELDVIVSINTTNPVSAIVKLDTGSSFCIFQRYYAESLGLEVEKGTKESIRTAKGNFTSYGHEVLLEFSNLSWTTTVYFAQDESFPVSVLGRIGFLDRLKIGLVDYEQLLYVNSYN